MKGAMLLILLVLCAIGPAQATIAGCLVYGSPANGKEVCSKCEDFRVATLIGDVCLECPPGCVECDVAKKCLRCRESLYLVANTGECKTCGVNCAKCDGPLCGKCSSGHFLDSSRSFCVRCSENCVECQNANMCTACLSNYELGDKNGNRVCNLKITTADILILSTLAFVGLCIVIICICCCCAMCADKPAETSRPATYNNNQNNYQPMRPAPAPYNPGFTPQYNPAYNAGYNPNAAYGYGPQAYNQFNAGY